MGPKRRSYEKSWRRSMTATAVALAMVLTRQWRRCGGVCSTTAPPAMHCWHCLGGGRTLRCPASPTAMTRCFLTTQVSPPVLPPPGAAPSAFAALYAQLGEIHDTSKSVEMITSRVCVNACSQLSAHRVSWHKSTAFANCSEIELSRALVTISPAVYSEMESFTQHINSQMVVT